MGRCREREPPRRGHLWCRGRPSRRPSPRRRAGAVLAHPWESVACPPRGERGPRGQRRHRRRSAPPRACRVRRRSRSIKATTSRRGATSKWRRRWRARQTMPPSKQRPSTTSPTSTRVEGNLDAARMHSSASFEVAERAGDRAAAGASPHVARTGRRGRGQHRRGGDATARRRGARARAADDPRATALALYELGYLRWRKDDLREAADLLSESLAIVRRLGDREVASAAARRARAAGRGARRLQRRRRVARGRPRAGATRRLRGRHRETLFNLGRVALDLGQPSLAVERLEEALKLADACRAPRHRGTRAHRDRPDPPARGRPPRRPARPGGGRRAGPARSTRRQDQHPCARSWPRLPSRRVT